MIEKDIKNNFPSQIVSDVEKQSDKYGLSVAKAIEHEWFSRDSSSTRFNSYQDGFHKLRLYARGELSLIHI